MRYVFSATTLLHEIIYEFFECEKPKEGNEPQVKKQSKNNTKKHGVECHYIV